MPTQSILNKNVWWLAFIDSYCFSWYLILRATSKYIDGKLLINLFWPEIEFWTFGWHIPHQNIHRAPSPTKQLSFQGRECLRDNKKGLYFLDWANKTVIRKKKLTLRQMTHTYFNFTTPKGLKITSSDEKE